MGDRAEALCELKARATALSANDGTRQTSGLNACTTTGRKLLQPKGGAGGFACDSVI